MRRVCVFRPSMMARTIAPLNSIGFSFMCFAFLSFLHLFQQAFAPCLA
jgi:hypothetical protein